MKRLLARIAPIAFVTLASVGIYACSDSTGPNGGGGRTATITLQPVFQSAAAGVVNYTRAHVIARRSDNSVALDTTFNYTSNSNSAIAAQTNGGSLRFIVPLSRVSGVDGEDFLVDFELLDNAGNVVFRGGPISVRGDPDTPANANATTLYVGTGSNALRVEIAPASTTAATGATVDFVAKAFGPNDTELPGTPIRFTSETPTLATVANDAVGRAVMGNTRGTARIRATLVTGQTADALVTIKPPATTLAIQSGNNQSVTVNAAAQPLVVKVTAADGVGVDGVQVSFAIQSGGGTLGAAQVTTGADGVASVGYTVGPTPGPVTILASVQGLTGSPATFTITGTASAVTQIVFASQPTNALVGSSIGTVTVEARDQFGNRATSFTGSINVTLDAPPVGVTISGTQNVNAVAGVATFTGLTVSAPANGLRLIATLAGVPTTTSSTFNITPRQPATLAFTTQPPGAIPATDLFNVAVTVRDDLGNTASTYTGNVTIALETTPPGISLGGALTSAAVNGVAVFTLNVNAQTPSLRLVATAVGVPGSALSTQFAVAPPTNPLTANPPSATFLVQRLAASPAPAVVNLTSLADPVTGLTVGAITYGPGATGWLGAALGGTTTPTTLTLTPTTGALPEGTFSATVPVTGAGGISLQYSVSVTVTPLPVTQLVVITQPGAAASGANFGVQPVIELQDATSTRVLGATNAVTASVATGTGTLAGTVTRTAVQGRVNFLDLRITGTGAHTLQFTMAGPITVTSASFNVAAALSTTLAVANVSGTSGTAIAPVTPVTATGGVVPLAFAVSPPLPGGLLFNTTTGQITGTPAAASGPSNFVVTATDAAGTQSSKTFSLTINAGLTTTQVIASRSGDVGTAIPSFIPVTAAGGTAPITFAVAPLTTLTGVGLTFNAATGAVSGTPTGTLATTTFTVTATDNVGATSSKTFDLTINPALTTTQVIATKVGTLGAAIASFVPVTATPGTNPITFAISPAATLSSIGLTFTAATGAIAGTPSATLAATVFTVTATDAVGGTSSKTFTLTINPALTTTLAVPNTTGTQGSALSFTPVTAAGGTAPITFAVSTPAALTGIGLTFDVNTGLVSGTPTGPIATTAFTVTATDAAGATSQKVFNLTVNGPLTTTQAIAARTVTQSAAITPFTPVTAAGGTPPIAFAIAPLATFNATGLTFNTATGAISGTPTTTLATTTFTVTATDNIGATSSKTFDLTINAALTTTQVIPTQAGTVGIAVGPFTPVTAANGTAPITFSIAPAGTLTGIGLSINPATGAISGTPTGALAATVFTVTATDAVGATSSKTFTLTVNAAVTTTQAIATKFGDVGTAIAAFTPVTAAGGTAPLTFSIAPLATLTGIGLSINAATGAISGTPTGTLAATVFTVTATDNVGSNSSKTFTLTINAALTTTQAIPTQAVTQGAAVNFTPVTAAGGTAPITFSIAPLATLSGVSLSINAATGAITGTPTGPLAATVFTVTATDNIGATSAKTFSLTINGPLTTTLAVANTTGTQGNALSFTPVTAAGGTAPITFSVSSLASLTGIGLTFNTANGLVSGTPTGPLAATAFTVTATDNAGATSQKTFNLTVNGPLTTTQAIAARTVTQSSAIAAFTPVTAAGGTAPITFAIAPLATFNATGLTFNTATGAISGTPTTTLATTTFTVTATDGAAATSSKTFDLTINAALTTTQVIPTQAGTQGIAVGPFTPVTAANGTAPITFSIAPAGTLTGIGLSINPATGAISGTPTGPLAATVFTVTATDAAGATSSKTFTLTINATLTTTQVIASRAGTDGTALVPFTPVTAAGGTAPITFSIAPLATLTGINLAFNTANGQVTGTPNAPLAATVFTVTATDNVGATSSKTFTLTINTALTTTLAVPSTTGTQGNALSFTPVTSAGGTAPITFSVSSPATLTGIGLTFNASSGLVSGTPTGALANTAFTVTATDAAGATSQKIFNLTVNGPLTTTLAVPNTTGTAGNALSFTPVTAAGGTAPITFSVSSLATLTGINLTFNTANGLVSGTPSGALANTAFTVTATDNAGATSQKTFNLTVNGPLTTVQAIPARSVTQNTAITPFTPVTAAGGTPAITFAIAPLATFNATGLAFNTSNGSITGTPTAVLATTTFTVTATDNIGATSSKTFDLTINPAITTTLVIPSTTGTQGTALTPFTPVTAANGTAPITFSVAPLGGLTGIGLTFNTATGQVSGTPTGTLAATNFTVTATDNVGATSSKVFSLTINATLTTTQAIASRSVTQNSAITAFTPVTAAGGTAPITFAITNLATFNGTGLSFNTATGQISGTPTSTLAATVFTVTATDNVGATSSKTFTLTVNNALTTTQAIASQTVTQSAAVTPFTPVTAANGTAPITFAITNLAAFNATGLSFNTATGQISGTPTTALATTTFTVTATDAAGATSAKTFDLTINTALTTTQAIASRSVTQNSAIIAFTPVTAAGGTGPITFAITNLATFNGTGLTFNTANGQISGTPTSTLTATVFTVTATDNVGATSSKTFTLTVNTALTTTQAIAARAVTQSSAITAFTPVTSAGGTAPVTFAIAPLATFNGTGLTFNTATGQISGTATATLAITNFTVTATDNAGATSSKTFDLTVNPALTTTLAVASQAVTQSSLITPFTPVTAANGTAPITFAITTNLAAFNSTGLTFSAATGQVSGTPTATLAATNITVTATDAAGATSSKIFSLTVNTALTTTQAIASRTGDVGSAMTAFTPVTAAGGTPALTFAITNLATFNTTGLTFNTANGQISGTPTATLAATVFTVTVTDNAGATSAKTFTLTINPALTTTQAIASRSVTQGSPITAFTPVTTAGGTAPVTLAITNLATFNGTGLTFNTTTGQISGTPTSTLAATVFTVTATDNIGVTSAKTFTLTVNAALTTTLAVPNTTGSQGVALSFTPVTAANGTAPITFAVTPLATFNGTGLTFNTNTGLVSGTPTSSLALTGFTVTATDAAGATSAKTFNLTINGPLAANQAVPSITLQAGTAITPTVPVTPSGGTSPYTFALTGTLPTGMAFNTSNGQLTGTPTTVVTGQSYTVTITDNVGATANNSFTLTVNAIQLNVSAAATATVGVAAAAACAVGVEGTCLAVPINIDMTNRGTDNLGALQVTITFDPTKLQFINESNGNGPGWSPFNNFSNAGTGTIVLSGFATTGLTANFTLHNLVFKPIGTSAGAAITAVVNSAATEGAAAIVVPVRNLTVTINP